jgi:MFS family permease
VILLLITCVLASNLAFIDGSVVNVALPAIERSQGGGAEGVQWLVTGYLLPLSALLMFGGSLGGRYGRRRILVLGVVLFAAASAASGLAPSLAILTAARFVQGIGAALLMGVVASSGRGSRVA